MTETTPTPTPTPPPIARRPTVADRITSLVFDDDDDDDATSSDAGTVASSDPLTRGMVSIRYEEKDEGTQREAPVVVPASSLVSDGSTLAPRKDSDSVSVSSTKSALQHEKAYVSGAMHAFIKVGQKLVNKIVSTSMGSGLEDSLEVMAAFEVLPQQVKQMHLDGVRNPEIFKDARVSQTNTIPEEEKIFQRARQKFARESFARFIQVPVEEIDERDIPIIAAGGSGGGLKAMIGTTGFLKAMEQEGLYDAITYLAGVSGSCWTLSNLYREATQASPTILAELLEATLDAFPGDPVHLQTILLADPLVRVPLLFGGMVSKRITGLPRGVVEVYSAFMQSHFYSTDQHWNDRDFKLSLQRRFMEGGKAPMPIHTAIRHERPWLARKDKDGDGVQTAYDKQDTDDMEAKQKAVEMRKAWWQWFELSPLEVGCDELKGLCGGISVDKVPEQNISMIVGTVASAMTAPFQTSCETLERSNPSSWIGSRIRGHAVKMLSPDASTKVKEILSMHPFHSAYNWNPMYKIRPGPHPPGLINSPRIQLIDAGADNNQPLYPFVRPGRNVDIIIVLDSSEDVERNIVTKDIENFGSRRGLKFTRTSPAPPDPADFDKPLPAPPQPDADTESISSKKEKESGGFLGALKSLSPKLSRSNLTEDADGKDTDSISSKKSSSSNSLIPTSPLLRPLSPRASRSNLKETTPPEPKNYKKRYENRYCQTFRGEISPVRGETVGPAGERVGEHGEPLAEKEVTMIYHPMIGNDGMGDEFSPSSFSFGKLQYSPKEVADLIKCAELDFMENIQRVRETVKGVWMKKRDARLAAEQPSVVKTE
ncbi:hypothetical protein HDU97_007118 [Phlyctochytrium planicorne]|nr:hypothetical protein HDU97_007118 [Phlyctochytrium planicorne]